MIRRKLRWNDRRARFLEILERLRREIEDLCVTRQQWKEIGPQSPKLISSAGAHRPYIKSRNVSKILCDVIRYVPFCPMSSRRTFCFLSFRVSPCPTSWLWVKNEQIFSLGLVLLEIGLGERFIKLDGPPGLDQGSGTDGTLLDVLKAQYIFRTGTLILEVGRRMGAGYARAVKFCFRFDAGLGKDDFARDDFQCQFYDNVGFELERLWKAFVL